MLSYSSESLSIDVKSINIYIYILRNVEMGIFWDLGEYLSWKGDGKYLRSTANRPNDQRPDFIPPEPLKSTEARYRTYSPQPRGANRTVNAVPCFLPHVSFYLVANTRSTKIEGEKRAVNDAKRGTFAVYKTLIPNTPNKNNL